MNGPSPCSGRSSPGLIRRRRLRGGVLRGCSIDKNASTKKTPCKCRPAPAQEYPKTARTCLVRRRLTCARKLRPSSLCRAAPSVGAALLSFRPLCRSLYAFCHLLHVAPCALSFLPFITRGPVGFTVGSLNFSRLPTGKIAGFSRSAASISERPF